VIRTLRILTTIYATHRLKGIGHYCTQANIRVKARAGLQLSQFIGSQFISNLASRTHKLPSWHLCLLYIVYCAIYGLSSGHYCTADSKRHHACYAQSLDEQHIASGAHSFHRKTLTILQQLFCVTTACVLARQCRLLLCARGRWLRNQWNLLRSQPSTSLLKTKDTSSPTASRNPVSLTVCKALWK
jgi:hypothetical protein